MRPSEIDFSITRKHYFDLANGEILQGKKDLNQYLENQDVNRNTIVYLGQLLRDGIPQNAGPYEQSNASQWSSDKLHKFGRWLSKIVPPPTNNHYHIDREVINNARQLGIGPSKNVLYKRFGSMSLFFKEIGVANFRYRGLHNDWELEDFISYIKQIGQEKRPTAKKIEEVVAKNPSLPSPYIINKRFQHIGGLKTILELAGYLIFENWNNLDYLDWGVKFMQANDGTIPTTIMVEYLSTQTKGPSREKIILNFNSIINYQNNVIDAYNEVKLDNEHDQNVKMSQLKEDLIKGNLPLKIFDLDSNKLTNHYLENRTNKQYVLSENDALILLNDIKSKFEVKELFKRYAMFKVLKEVIPYTSEEAQVSIVLSTINDPNKNFIREINRHYDENSGKIENAALVLGFFDDIWPMNQHLKTLKLDDSFEEYKKKRHYAKTLSRQKQRLALII